MQRVDESGDISDFALALAEKLNNQIYMASMYNNTGGLELERENYQSAVNSFETALNIRHQIADLAGQVAAGTNMLLGYFFLEDWDSFERLSTRVERLQQLQNSSIMLAYYDWLKTAFVYKDWQILNEEQIQQLRDYFIAVNDPGIQRFLLQIAKEQGWRCLQSNNSILLNRVNWISEHISPICDWNAIEQLPHEDIMVEFTRAKERLVDYPSYF